MKIITWNCNGALRKKTAFLSTLEADIYVIQECEDPAQSKDSSYQEWASNHLWIGENKNKGLGIFAKNNIQLERFDWSDQHGETTVKYFLPCLINRQFQLLGLWAHHNNSPNFGYIGQLWKYLQVNKHQFTQIILAGDFNSNSIWDEWDRWWNHSDVVRELQELQITSVYHQFFQETHGKETIPTFYLQRNRSKQYHIDYIFAHETLSQRIQNVEIG